MAQMAITNTAAPDFYIQAAFETLQWTFTSNNSGEDNFLMKCEVKNAAGTVIDTLYVDNDGSGNFIFDVGPSLRAQLTETILTLATTALTTTNSGSYFQYTLKLTEIYDDVDGLPMEGSTLTVSQLGGQDMYAYNFVYRDAEAYSDFFMSNGSYRKFLTTLPSSYQAAVGQYMQLAFITSESGVYGKIQQFNKSGGGTSTKVPSSGTVTPVGYRCILPIPAAYFVTTNAYLIVSIHLASNARISEELRINIGGGCADTGVCLLFKNHLGAFDTYTFMDYERVDSPKLSTYKSSGTKKTLYVEPQTQYDLYGRYESNPVLLWLSELYNSKVVYMVSGTSLVRVNVLSGSYDLGGWDLGKPKVRIEIQPLELN
jgi:hypothetical protein